jgi:hypothetical protein
MELAVRKCVWLALTLTLSPRERGNDIQRGSEIGTIRDVRGHINTGASIP